METLLNLGLALALGLLVGVERGWQEREAAEGSRLAGIRTFGLIYWTYRATRKELRRIVKPFRISYEKSFQLASP